MVVEKGHQFEVATFRKDEGSRDGRRPISIEPATPEKDAERRDFTINGLFYDPIEKKILDFVQGREDIKLGVIRAIGNPHDRFLEDRLRMIRAVRYASRFHFSIETNTLTAILEHSHMLFPSVSIERIWNEFCKMAAFPHFDTALLTLHRLNLLPIIFTELKETSPEEIQKKLHSLPYFPEEAPVIAKILELFPHTSLQERISIADYLKISNQEKEFITFYYHAKLILESKKEQELYEWAHLYAHPSFPICLKLIATHYNLEERQTFLQEHHMRQHSLQKAILQIQQKIPYLTSEHLRGAGIPNGKQMGVLLKEGERIAINESIENPEKIISYLKKTPLWKTNI